MKQSKYPLITFLSSEALSLFGNAAFLVILPLLILGLTGNVGQASLVIALSTIPAMIAGVIGGYVIDKFGRRRSSIIATLGCAIAALALTIVNATVGLNITWLIAIGMFANLFIIPGTTARDTLMPDIADASGTSIERVAGARQTTFGVAYLAGPGIAGLLLIFMPPIRVMLVVAASWLLAAIITRFLPVQAHAPQTTEEKKMTNDAGSVWQRVRHSPAILTAMIIGFGSSIITAPISSILLPAHFRAIHEPQQFGYVMAVLAVGSTVGALLYTAFAKKLRRLFYLGSVVAITLSLSIFVLLPNFWLLAGALLILGLSASLLSPFLIIAIVQNTPAAERGRVMGVFNALSLGASPIGLGLLSLLLHRASLRAGAVAVLIGWLVVAVVTLAAQPWLLSIKKTSTS